MELPIDILIEIGLSTLEYNEDEVILDSLKKLIDTPLIETNEGISLGFMLESFLSFVIPNRESIRTNNFLSNWSPLGLLTFEEQFNIKIYSNLLNPQILSGLMWQLEIMKNYIESDAVRTCKEVYRDLKEANWNNLTRLARWFRMDRHVWIRRSHHTFRALTRFYIVTCLIHGKRDVLSGYEICLHFISFLY